MRVKTDIYINCTKVYISKRLARIIDAKPGMVLKLNRAGNECLVSAHDNEDGIYSGQLYFCSGGYRCSDSAFVAELVGDTKSKAAFRCGESVNINGTIMAYIITKRNYAKNGNTN